MSSNPVFQVFIVDILGRVISRLFGFVLGHLALDVTGLIVQIIQRVLLDSVGLVNFFFVNVQSILLRLVGKTRQVPVLIRNLVLSFNDRLVLIVVSRIFTTSWSSSHNPCPSHLLVDRCHSGRLKGLAYVKGS